MSAPEGYGIADGRIEVANHEGTAAPQEGEHENRFGVGRRPEEGVAREISCHGVRPSG